jgi:hypothetical protein
LGFSWGGVIIAFGEDELRKRYGKSHRIFHLASVGDRAFKSAIAAHVVFHKLTIRERALDEQAIVKTASAEDAISELAFYERADIKKSPVPIDVLEGAVVEIGVNTAAI